MSCTKCKPPLQFRITKKDVFRKNKSQSFFDANKSGVIDMNNRKIRELSLNGKIRLIYIERELLEMILSPDPRERPSAKEALLHPFFTEEDDSQGNIFKSQVLVSNVKGRKSRK